jgi:serine/threonine protein kinase/Flp pilus assembly protein TadD
MDADRNLLFGVLALQADLLTPARFAEACSAWAACKDKSLAELLVERGWLSPVERADVDKLLQRKLAKHSGEAQASPAQVTSEPVRQALAGRDDPAIDQTLDPASAGDVVGATAAYVPGARDRYTLSRLHATGGIGRVWLARDAAIGRAVALKELRPERTGQPVMCNRFLREAQVTGQLEHPGIVPVYELGRRAEDGAPFYTMRFVRGRTLAEAARTYHERRNQGGSGPMELRELLTAVVGVCNAVAYAHSRGVLHRDLKPQNVVLGDYGEVVVLDWGLAKVAGDADGDTAPVSVEPSAGESDERTLAGDVLGTPAYMAPEQAEGRLDLLDARTDVYGLGAVLYEVLTGKPPFGGAESTDVLRRVVQDPPVPPRALVSGTPQPLEAICLKALEKKSADRYGSAKALAAEVQRFLADEPVTAYRDPLTTRLTRWGRRHRATVSGLVALLATLTAALAVGLAVVRAEKGKTETALADKAVEAIKAREAADRAKRAETKAQIELGRTAATAARLSAQRGKWDEALSHYRQALLLEPEDEVALQLGILECHTAKYDYASFRQALAALAARTDLGSHRGEVRLQQATETLLSARQDAEPVKMVGEALALGLPPADEAFARALIAPTVPIVVERLQQAARLAPHHRRTHELLPGMLFLLGRLPEMREAVGRLQLIAPNSLTTRMWHCYLLTLDNNLDAANAECERLRPEIGDDGVQISRLMIRLLNRMGSSEFVWEPDEKRLALAADLLASAPTLSRLLQDSSDPRGAERWADLAMYRLPCFRAMADHPLLKNKGSLTQIMALVQPKAMNELAARLVESVPNGMFVWMQATWLHGAGRLPEAEAALGRALELPSPFPIQRVALAELTALQFERLAKEPPEARPKLKELIRANLRQLAGRGTYPPLVCDHLASYARQVDEPALALVFSEAYVRQAPGDVDALRGRFMSESALGALGRAAVTSNELLAREPTDASLVNQRAVLEFRQGFFANAAASCFEALRLDPKQPDAAGNLATIETEVRRRQAIYGVTLEKLRLRPALILAHQGEHAEAVKAVGAEKQEGDTAMALACLYAVASRAAAGDTKLTPEERRKKAEEHAVKSIDLLRRGHEAGYFKSPDRVRYLNTEHDFDTLHDREEYKRLKQAIPK